MTKAVKRLKKKDGREGGKEEGKEEIKDTFVRLCRGTEGSKQARGGEKEGWGGGRMDGEKDQEKKEERR